jgi:hypothetical protein
MRAPFGTSIWTDEPAGKTEFSFKAGDLDFHSDSYEWLVLNQGGTNAQFKEVVRSSRPGIFA